MLNRLFGSRSAELVLYYLSLYEKGYATKISRLFGISLNTIQKQLIKFEDAGILVSFSEGRTKLYQWNPRYPFLAELRALLDKALDYLPDSEKLIFAQNRSRPRRTGKPP